MQLLPNKINLKISPEINEALIDYQQAQEFMQNHVQKIHDNTETDLIWLLQHPPIYTGGISAKPTDLLEAERFPVYQTNRGGQYTYHGPGQRIIYVMLDLRQHQDIRLFVSALEQWVINTLQTYGIAAFTLDGKIGIWVQTDTEKYAKIAALGIRIRKWISFHGLAVNINPDLSHFNGIVPCGINAQNYGVTSLHQRGVTVTMQEFDQRLVAEFPKLFGAKLVV
ncbi:MAG: lipoyl(octanoyl) transferase LipB [Alphaproteobacteria bacterium]|nr:lipoyl(octanoyl) transferase LipB [Alphaproteobacteria bacterium]